MFQRAVELCDPAEGHSSHPFTRPATVRKTWLPDVYFKPRPAAKYGALRMSGGELYRESVERDGGLSWEKIAAGGQHAEPVCGITFQIRFVLYHTRMGRQ